MKEATCEKVNEAYRSLCWASSLQSARLPVSAPRSVGVVRDLLLYNSTFSARR